MLHAVDWRWHTNDREALYWHWSPRYGWDMDHVITGWNECLITYVMAAASPTHGISSSVYHRGWTSGDTFRNGQSYYGITLPETDLSYLNDEKLKGLGLHIELVKTFDAETLYRIRPIQPVSLARR